MNGYVWFFLLTALTGTTLYIYIPSWIRHWRNHNRQVNADIRFMRSIPKGMEDEQ